MAETATLITAIRTYLEFLETVDRHADELLRTAAAPIPDDAVRDLQRRWSQLQTNLTLLSRQLESFGMEPGTPEQFLILCGLRRGE